jgi:hypothetical protein
MARTKREPDVKIECLYIFYYGNMVKVGISSDPWSRLSSIQVGLPEDLQMGYLIIGQDREKMFQLEQRIHRRLAHRHVRGEWFRIDLEEAVAVAAREFRRTVPRRLRDKGISFPSVAEAVAFAESLRPGDDPFGLKSEAAVH